MSETTPGPDANPFQDPDRRRIWEILVRDDIEAVLALDFDLPRPRFDEERFVGYDARRSPNPSEWTIGFPTLESYARAWIDGVRELHETRFAPGTPALDRLLYEVATLERITVEGDHALARKRFDRVLETAEGPPFSWRWQSLYFLRRDGADWLVTGFLGYLPSDMPAAQTPTP